MTPLMLYACFATIGLATLIWFLSLANKAYKEITNMNLWDGWR